MDNGDFSPLSNSWSAKEFVQLLDGLEQFGYGNWNDVSRYEFPICLSLQYRV